MSDDKFDAIVVGAGMAGTAAAYLLAKAGKSVLLVELGDGAVPLGTRVEKMQEFQ